MKLARFPDVHAALSEMDELPESFLSDLKSAYDDDVAEFNAASEAAQAERIDADANSAAAIAERDATIADLRNKNYTLMTATASDNAGGGTNDDDTVTGDEGSDIVESPEQTTIDSLFSERD